jgi:hypothetical protein
LSHRSYDTLGSEDRKYVMREEIIRDVMKMEDSITLVRQAWIYKGRRIVSKQQER